MFFVFSCPGTALRGGVALVRQRLHISSLFSMICAFLWPYIEWYALRALPAPVVLLVFALVTGYDTHMSDIGWNSVEIGEEERPRVTPEDLQEMLADLDPEELDEPVQEFLSELERGGDAEDLRRAATLLLQDEVDFAPELQSAGIEPDEQLISLLLAVGADVNAGNAYGEPPLHLAARYGYSRIVDMLLAAGANLRVRNSRGELAADVAADAQLAARLAPPLPEDALPPEIEDADLEPSEESHCCCHEHGHSCSCGHHHHHHHCDCGGHGKDCECGLQEK